MPLPAALRTPLGGVGILTALTLLLTALVVLGSHRGTPSAEPTRAQLTATQPLVVVPGQRLTAKPRPKPLKRDVPAANPLAAGPWGVYRGPWNGIYPAYQKASGTNKALLAKIALRPRVLWFTGNFSTKAIGPAIAQTIKAQQKESGPDTLVQLALFRIWVGGENARGRALSAKQQIAYRQWIDAAAAAIGSARTALVLEPDLGLAAIPNNAWERRTKDSAVRLALVRYAAQRLSALPRTSVYLDASDADWLAMKKIVPLLTAAGVEYTRGFALGATHYTSVQDNLAYGKQISDQLAAAGIPGKHFVIDTADNGRAFTWAQNRAGRPGGNFDNANTCRSIAEVRCDTLGIPPTADVTDPRLGLTAAQAQVATQYADGYLWFGRPWLVNQAAPFSLKRSLAVAATTPFQ